jgi:hypothetical protein
VNVTEARACLGLTPDATLAEAQAAYRRRAAMLHPDKHATASPAMQQEAARAMQQLSEALAVLQQPGPPQAERLRARPPLPHECTFCGWSPAIHVTIRRVIGLVVWHRVETLSEPLCSACGLGMWRETQAATLTRGWWGWLAWALALHVLVTNLPARRALTRLDPPSRRAPEVRALFPMPVPPVRPVPRRPAVWTSCAVALFLAIAVSLADPEPNPETAPPDARPDLPPAGTCFDHVGLSVDCDSPSAIAQVTRHADNAAQCVPGDVYLPYPDLRRGVCLRRLPG